MGNILNPNVDNTRLYDKEKVNIQKDMLANESGGMPTDISENLTQL